MKSPKCVLLLLSLYLTAASAGFLTGTYPAPIDLSSKQSIVATNWKNLSQVFDGYLKNNKGGGAADSFAAVKNVTFSVGLFSIHDPAASELQYHYTSPEIAKAPNGTNKVDANSIYRVASVSKLVTVFAGMLHLTEEDWNRPITQIIPDLATVGTQNSTAYTIEWDQITPWALATQLAGIPAYGIAAGDLLFQFAQAAIDPTTTLGLPPLNISTLGPCLDFTCSASSFAKSFRSQTPTLQTWTSPVYSDGAFVSLLPLSPY